MGHVSTLDQEYVQRNEMGRRIAELLEDKGISPNSFCQKIGMAKSTFYNCLHGERIIKPSELELMGTHLKIPIARIRQEDTRSDWEELTRLLQDKLHLKRALELARGLCSVALGVTERSRALNDLGRVLYLLEEYEEAHTVWIEAHRYSEKLLAQYGESKLYFLILSNLMISYTLRREYSHAREILAKVEPVFEGNPKVLGDIHYTRATLAEDSGNIGKAKQHAYAALQSYETLGDERVILKAEVNAAHYEYKDRRYVQSQLLLERALGRAVNDPYLELFVIKEYVKTLLKLKQISQAKQILQQTLENKAQELHMHPLIRDKLFLLLSVAQNERQHAEQLLFSEKADRNVRRLAYLFLRSICIQEGDEVMLLKYSEIAYHILNSENVLDEEEL